MRPGVHTRVSVVLIVILAEDDGASFLSGIPPNVNKISSSSVIFLHKKSHLTSIQPVQHLFLRKAQYFHEKKLRERREATEQLPVIIN